VVSHAPFPFSLGSRVLSNSVGMPPELPCCFRVCLSNHDKLILYEIAIQDDVAFLLAVASLALPCCTLDLVLPWPLFAQTPFLEGRPNIFVWPPLPSALMMPAGLPTRFLKMAEDDIEDQILELIREDPSLGPKVLMMLQNGMLCPQPVNGEDPKWNLLGKDRCIALLSCLSDKLTAPLLDKWPKEDVETLLAFALDVEDSWGLGLLGVWGPAERMSEVQQWVRTRASLVGDRLQSVVFTEDTPKKVDWQKFGVFEIIPAAGGQGKLIRHRLNNEVSVALPAELEVAPNLTLIGNYSASKALLKTDLTQVSVLKIFRRHNVEIPMPLFERASSPRSATTLSNVSEEANAASPRSAPESASPAAVPSLPLPRGNGSAANAPESQHGQETEEP